MLKFYKRILALSALLVFGLHVPGSATAPFVTSQEFNDGYRNGLANGATHMLIIWDIYDFEDTYQFISYCSPEQDINDVIEYYTAPGFYKVAAVYDLR